jgi:energy-coupling factor transporter ATP-binding protein EcfA2
MSAKSVLKVLADLNSVGVTIVLVEHRLEMVSHLADRCVIFDSGRIVLDGPPQNVLYSDIAEHLGIGVPKAVLVAKAMRQRSELARWMPLTSRDLLRLLGGNQQ